MNKGRPPPSQPPPAVRNDAQPPGAAPQAPAGRLKAALALQQQGRLHEAAVACTSILESAPRHFGALHLLATIAAQRRNLAAAVGLFDQALAINPHHAGALFNRGKVLRALGRTAEALESYDGALAINPAHAEALGSRGNALLALGRREDALQSYDRAVDIRPDYAEAWSNRGNVLNLLERHQEALASCDHALAIRPDFPEALNNRGNALLALKRPEEALESYARAVAAKPAYAEAHYNRGLVLYQSGRLGDAVESYRSALAIKPDYEFLLGMWLHAKMKLCDWSDLAAQFAQLAGRIARREPASPSFPVLAMAGSRPLERIAAETWVRAKHPAGTALPPIARQPRRDRIRLGYFSADFHNHATAYLMAELFERHDRTRFELTAFSFGPQQNDEMRKRVAAAFDRFVDVRDRSDKDVALLSRSLGIDIAIDLKGFTQDSRAGIFALRAAPLQVSYLGYPGTMGAEFMDYLIADPILIPESHRQDYAEKIAYLPDSYQVNDTQRPIAGKEFTREELGLPPGGFVFCCFNNNYKITPGTFDAWMRILGRVPGSVLWLLEGNPTAAGNLRMEAGARGVDPARLVFAQYMPLAEHLARHRAADLFLDTLPYNAHTTASDALWAGLPVLTCLGETFAGRVAASLLNAIRLPELVASTPAGYEALAIELATNPERLGEIRRKLAANRLTTPLFDCRRFTRDIEAAYSAMYDRYQAGLAPATIPAPAASPNDLSMKTARAKHRQGLPDQAEALCKSILQSQPRHFDALQLMATIAAQRGNSQAAAALFNQALELRPDHAQALNNRGYALLDLKRPEDALRDFQRALEIKPDFAEAFSNRGNALLMLQRREEALESYDCALKIKPDYAEALTNRGNALLRLKRVEEALASYDRALGIRPDYVHALNNRGNALRDLGRFQEALASYDSVLEIRPDHVEALCQRGVALYTLKRLEDALESYRHALAINPDHEFLFGRWLHTKMQACDWSDLATNLARLAEGVGNRKRTCSPFPVLAMAGSRPLDRIAAETWVLAKHPGGTALPPIARQPRRDRIRLGYFSADFHNHATTYLMAELFERHDRSRFELTAFSFGPQQNDEMRQRVAAAFDRFVNVRDRSNSDVALLARSLGIDIAVDLKGFTRDSRGGIFALRAAPLQVSYLGYPGTMGAEFMDYLIADPTLIPESHRQDYAEKIAYLPHSYQVNDTRRPIAARSFTREELGLPPGGFVFCCFNNNYKITPGTFNSWMRILERVPGSVLWLLEGNPTAAGNLRREAQARDLDPARLVFANRMPLPEHLARHRAADLFLDTLPYNAHTTASDALWAGLPVLTCLGETFAGRVAASLLNAIRLPELVTSTPAGYEALAIELATNPGMLGEIHRKLAANRLTTPLFDCRRFTRDIEAAYSAMYDRYQTGLAPDHVFVKP